MTKYTCNVDGGNDEAGITITVSDGSVIESFTVTDAESLNELKTALENLDTKYVDNTELTNTLKNPNVDIEINATKLNNLASDKYAKKEDIQDFTKVPENHASPNTTYGLGNTSNYGHLKITDELTSTRSDTALSAKAGKTINDKVTTLSTSTAKNSLRIFLGRNRTDHGEQGTQLIINQEEQIYARVACDITGYDYTQNEVVIVANGTPYKRALDSTGKSDFLTIRLNPGTYMITAFVRGNDELYTASDMKILIVQ